MDRVDYQSLVIQDLINLENAQEIELSPWYQRRSVWSDSQKSYLINTLFEKKPIPAIYVRHSLNLEKSKSIKEIVDGQQRVRTIVSYCQDEFSAKHPQYKPRVKFSQLNTSQQHDFLLTGIPVGYLLGASDADVIDIFGRINSVSKSLNSQEKRNALFSGEMKQFCLKEASSRIEFWRAYSIFTANDIARMNETQFVSDVIYNLVNGLSDFSSRRLDNFYKEFDEDFADSQKVAKRLDRVFDTIAEIDPDQFSATIFNRQPLFFSLLLVLDEQKRLSAKKIEKVIWEIDARFQDASNTSHDDSEFRKASLSTTQRIKQRTIRHNYIKSFF
ncbi:MAG TPA: DUF262 domain-containing protein [Alcanivorax sp.]|nr:DUF262 domain-containing protein [Alcanivorax sp.]